MVYYLPHVLCKLHFAYPSRSKAGQGGIWAGDGPLAGASAEAIGRLRNPRCFV